MSSVRLAVVAILIPAALVLGGCGSSSSSSSSTTAASTTKSASAATTCTKANLSLLSAGKLTVGTDKPAYPPYFDSDTPSNGKGFESAVAYAIAKQLGFSAAEVTWTTVPFNSSYAPGPKKFDFDINQISITPPRAKRVDFSEPYFTAPQAVVALNGSGADGATSLADLAKTKIGVQVGTTSLDAANATIQPSAQPQVFNDSNDV
ncbi:MAG: polar amino acid transport system substrate-binding protein, partial [Baekduia sp.]|nr:polar amino acid transport system substrate-binding protein [Baekduia sp.]